MMNERIRELAEQARFNARNEKHYLERVHNREFTVDEYQEIYDKKFAELIVRECGYYADIFAAAGCPVDMDPTETAPSDYIKRQFGIKIELPKELK